MKVSIIIPVYNAEKYLKECLDSVVVSLGEIPGEILAINNDSDDDSLAILEDYAKKHQKVVRVLQCHTPGAAAVKNYGVSKAKGEYIWFIDADDTIAEEAVSVLTKKADETGADLVMMGAERVYENGSTDDGRKNHLVPVSDSDPEYKSKFVRYGMGPWQVLIRRKWWNQH
jgi:glycosyltransferase involved in cell wall biosynthesis